MARTQLEPVAESQEEDLAPRRPRRPRGLLLTIIGLGLAAFLLWDLRADIAYWFSAPPSVELGGAGGYHLDRAADGALARIAGMPGGSATRFSRYGKRYEIVAVRGTNILVRRELTGPELPRRPGVPEPAPEQTAFVADGRLVKDSSIPAYGDAFRILVERGDATPRDGHLFVLLDGDRPRSGWHIPAAVLGLGLLVGLNLWSLVRFVRRSVG